eukprot:gene3930-721_t
MASPNEVDVEMPHWSETKGVNVTWTNIEYIVHPTKKCCLRKDAVEILKAPGMSGTAMQGRTLAIMGPSGAGKTTLLNAISDRLDQDRNHVMKGRVYLNGVPYQSKYKSLFSFVTQDDILFASFNPKELLDFNAGIRARSTRQHRQQVVSDTIQVLALDKCSKTRVGEPGLARGLSGGERKRTSVACELVSKPSVIFLDEPTTGLDSSTALTLIGHLKTLAREQHKAVVFTVHQPSSDIFHEFDDLLLLAEGRVAYHGPANQALAYSTLSLAMHCSMCTVSVPLMHITYCCYPGHFCEQPTQRFPLNSHAPPVTLKPMTYAHLHTTILLTSSWLYSSGRLAWGAATTLGSPPACFGMLSCSYTLKNVATGRHAAPEQNDNMQLTTQHESGGSEAINALVPKPANLVVQFGYCWLRAVQNYIRSPGLLMTSLITNLVFSVIIGALFWNLGCDQESVQDRVGHMNLMFTMTNFSALQVVAIAFSLEKAIFLKENANRCYSPSAYYWGKSFAEIPLGLPGFFLAVTVQYLMAQYVYGLDNYLVFLSAMLLMASTAMAIGLVVAAMAPNAEVALMIVPLIGVPMMLAGGLMVSADRLAPYWLWLQYISLPRYAFISTMKIEFGDIDTLACESPDQCPYPTGDAVLEAFGVDDEKWNESVNKVVCVLELSITGN